MSGIDHGCQVNDTSPAIIPKYSHGQQEEDSLRLSEDIQPTDHFRPANSDPFLIVLVSKIN